MHAPGPPKIGTNFEAQTDLLAGPSCARALRRAGHPACTEIQNSHFFLYGFVTRLDVILRRLLGDKNSRRNPAWQNKGQIKEIAAAAACRRSGRPQKGQLY